MALSAYCESYKRWRMAVETMHLMASSNPATSGLMVKRTDGNPAPNPLLHIARKAADDMVRYAGEFGMTPVARARISAGVGYEPPRGGGKFGDLIA